MIGTTIGNYVVREKIGEGGMGVVYVAEHPRIGRKVAIKVLLPEFSQNAEVVSRFFTEARASSAIKNEHIIDIIDFGELPDKSSYIIMEWLEGESLAVVLEREKKLAVDRALHIARGMGRALAAAHRNGIVHRDLKPDNIFLVPRGEDPDFAKVLDFGIAKLLGNEGAGAPALASKTRTGAIIGTPMYMSPEQCRGVAVDARSDIYSFAVIVYQMLVGKIPFEAEGLGELLLKHMTEAPQALRELEPSVPEGVEAAVLRALAKDPDQRYRRVEDFIAELGTSLTNVMPTYRPATPMTAPPTAVRANAVGATDTIGSAAGETVLGTRPPRPRSKPLYVIVPAIAIALVGIGVVLRRGPDPIDKIDNPAIAKPAATIPAAKVEPEQPVPPAPKAPDKPAPVRLSVRATPPEAKIFIDGVERSNVYAEDLPPDGHVYEVEVRLAGYVTRREKLTLDQPRELAVSLIPDHAQKSRGAHKLPAAPPVAAAPTPAASTPAAKSDHPAAAATPDKGPTIYKGTKGKLLTEDPFVTDK